MPPTSERAEMARRAAPFALAAALAFGAAAFPPLPTAAPLAVAGLLCAAIVAAVSLSSHLALPRWGGLAPPVAYLAVVALMRTAQGGGESGYDVLVLLPVFWVALYGTRPQLAAMISCVAVLFLLPLIGVGGYDVPLSEGRTAGLLLILSCLVGFTVQELVNRTREQSRRASEQHGFLETILGSAQSLVAVLDANGVIERVNAACERSGGWSPGELVGKHLWELLPPAESEVMRAGWEHMRPSHFPQTIEGDWQQRNGVLRRLVWSNAALLDEHGEITHVVATGIDVTEQRAAEAASRSAEAERAESDHRYRMLVSNLPDALISLYDRDLRGVMVDGPMLKKQGLSPSRFEGRLLHEALPPDRVAALEPPIRRALDGETGHVEYQSHVGETIYAVDFIPYVRDGSIDGVFTISRDITERKRIERQLQHMADHDPLTGLLNRRRFAGELERHVTQVARYGTEGAVILLDIDRFKAVNDTLGHKAGDQLIVEVAQILDSQLRASDQLARLGGDEFAILLPRATRADAAEVADKLVRGVRETVSVDGGESAWAVTISVGVVLFDRMDLTADEVIVEADIAMYDAKGAGRDRYAFFSPGRARAAPIAGAGWAAAPNGSGGRAS